MTNKLSGLQLLGAAIKAPFITTGVAADASIRGVYAMHKSADAFVDGIELAVHYLNMGMINAHVASRKIMKDQGYDPELDYQENLKNMSAKADKEEEQQEEPSSSEKKEEDLPDLNKLSDEQIMMVVLKNKERLQKLFGEKAE